LLALIQELDTPGPARVLEGSESASRFGRDGEPAPPREARRRALYYYEPGVARDGEVLEVTESRVSQLHHNAILAPQVELRRGPVEETV
jgi:hypothetical protein